MRGGPKQFTHSKLMAWVAADRAVKAVEQFDLDGPVERWRALRDEIRRDILTKGYDTKRKTFTQFYGSQRAGRRAADDAAGRLPAGRPTSGCAARSRRSSGS